MGSEGRRTSPLQQAGSRRSSASTIPYVVVLISSASQMARPLGAKTNPEEPSGLLVRILDTRYI